MNRVDRLCCDDEQVLELFKAEPELLNSVGPDDVPESFHLATVGATFDCAPLTSVRGLPGVDEINVIQPPVKGQPGTQIRCP